MKRFHYSLESLMRLKQARLNDELVKLDQIASLITQIDRHRAELDQMNWEASRAAAEAGSVEGWQLASLHRFRRFAIEEDRRLSLERLQLVDQLEGQRLRVVEAHKKVRILEVLKERRLADWKTDVDREQDKAVSDLVVSRWKTKRER